MSTSRVCLYPLNMRNESHENVAKEKSPALSSGFREDLQGEEKDITAMFPQAGFVASDAALYKKQGIFFPLRYNGGGITRFNGSAELASSISKVNI